MGTLPDEEWKKEIKKARRGCIITITNHTSRTFNLVQGKGSE